MSPPIPAIRNPKLLWLLVPLLAVVAFAPTLWMWFLSDDFGHLFFNKSLAFPKALIAFDAPNMFYRPVSTVLTWNLGYELFGTNALPYHIVTLLCHALAALFLGRAVAVIADDMRVGWLAGAVFAVYPLCTEPLSWLASQWDVLGAVCVAGAVWGFAVAWRTRSRRAYALSLLAAFLAVTMKESTLPLPLIIPFVALAAELAPRVARAEPLLATMKEWRALASRIIVWSLPFALPTILFVGLRLAAAGRIGGYPNAAQDIHHFFWDSLVTATLETLMPLNRTVFSRTFVQLVGFLISGFVLVGLTLWGRKRWPLLLLALVWWLGFIAPVLNLIPTTGTDTHENNRVFYQSMMGFAIAIGALSIGFLEGRRARVAGWTVAGLVLLASIPIAWIQLQPWVDASRQTRHVLDETHAMIQHIPDAWIDIYVKNLPDVYRGAYVFRNGLDSAMINANFNDQLTRIKPVTAFDPLVLVKPFKNNNGRYNLEFAFDPATKLFNINSLSGNTSATDPPSTATRLWDFRQCSGKPLEGIQPINASTECTGSNLAIRAENDDPILILPGLNIDLAGKKWVRLGVCARYPTVDNPQVAEWFWQTPDNLNWQGDRREGYYLSANKEWRVYWTYLRAEEFGSTITSLRLDPVNGKLNTQLAWISLDTP